MTKIVCALCLLIFAWPAHAGEPVPAVTTDNSAEPDWYQKFTFSHTETGMVTPDPTLLQTPSETLNLSWVKGERWSVSINLTSRDPDSPFPREQVLTEAKFHITPRISISGVLSFGADELTDVTAWENQEIETGIRLRSAFKF